MSRQTAIRNLQIITALDSLSYGLIYRFIGIYIQNLGGSHVTVGFLMIGVLIGELLSPEITKIFTQAKGKRYGLFIILMITMLTHIMLGITKHCWLAILMRTVFSSVNQMQTLCLALLIDKEINLNTREKLFTNFNVLNGSGYIFGPIISGYLLKNEKGFGYVYTLAAFLTLINILLLTTVEESCDCGGSREEVTGKSVLVKISEKVKENITHFRKCELEKNWDILLMKYWAVSGVIAFSKFPQLLKYNYDITSSVCVGYTVAYTNALVFASAYYINEAKANLKKYPLVFVSELAFFFITLFMFLACYAPTFEFFILLLIPFLIIRTFIMTMWEDLFLQRKDVSLSNLNNSAGVVAGVTIPLIFGVMCNEIGPVAVIVFTCVPWLLCWIITRGYSRYLETEQPVPGGDHCYNDEDPKNC